MITGDELFYIRRNNYLKNTQQGWLKYSKIKPKKNQLSRSIAMLVPPFPINLVVFKKNVMRKNEIFHTENIWETVFIVLCRI